MPQPTQGSLISGEWIHKSTGPTVLTASSVEHLSRAVGGAEIIIDNIVLCDNSGSGSTVTARKVASGGTDDGTANFLTAYPIGASETAIVPDNGNPSNLLFLNEGDSIKLLAANASRIVAHINYRVRR